MNFEQLGTEGRTEEQARNADAPRPCVDGNPSSRALEVEYANTLAAALSEIKSDPRYAGNILFGRPRKGHEEGSVAAHIEELELNLRDVSCFLEKIGQPLSNIEKLKLELLIHVHDSFKAEAEPGIEQSDPRSHASLARAYLADILPDREMLAMVQLHDGPWALFKQQRRDGSYDKARFDEILSEIPDQGLFQIFLIIDNDTASKVEAGEPGCVKWMISEAAPHTSTQRNLLELHQHVEGKAFIRKGSRN
jgi:hypothetical protein